MGVSKIGIDEMGLTQGKIKEVQKNVAVYSHALLKIHVIEVSEDCSFLPPQFSGPATPVLYPS